MVPVGMISSRTIKELLESCEADVKHLQDNLYLSQNCYQLSKLSKHSIKFL